MLNLDQLLPLQKYFYFPISFHYETQWTCSVSIAIATSSIEATAVAANAFLPHHLRSSWELKQRWLLWCFGWGGEGVAIKAVATIADAYSEVYDCRVHLKVFQNF